jgi:hypothetical protein
MEGSFSGGGALPIPQMWNVPERFFECSSGASCRQIGQKSDLVANRPRWTPRARRADRAHLLGPPGSKRVGMIVEIPDLAAFDVTFSIIGSDCGLRGEPARVRLIRY